MKVNKAHDQLKVVGLIFERHALHMDRSTSVITELAAETTYSSTLLKEKPLVDGNMKTERRPLHVYVCMIVLYAYICPHQHCFITGVEGVLCQLKHSGSSIYYQVSKNNHWAHFRGHKM